jgi:Holliday junction resolvase RusA-like endonuclease
MTPYEVSRLAGLLRALGGIESPGPVHFFVALGEPRSKARPRFANGRTYRTDTDRAAQETIGWVFRRAYGNTPPAEGNVALAALFYRSSHQPVDVDNMLKLIADAGTGIAYNDDRQVTATAGIAEFDRENPRTVFAIAPHASTLQRGHRTYPCEGCAKPLRVPKTGYGAKKCPSCRARNALKDCPVCGKAFKPKSSSIINCSRKCSGLARTGRAKGRRKPTPSTCPKCGGPKPNDRAATCRACWRVRVSATGTYVANPPGGS